ncbi:sulfite exporter TauE/SafE family protein [Mangrovimicrobium sediminis]|uniref:Probable membrane transporter protein n=1 Tax=Mangrovimicrobium sediminis TaxID=2562682 RepID=A0A4Z0M549_9GAMM|nr:sulfite exporter TauE/SafE family protein [Haliea sp. SAOS-164]TGD74601.1 sulfite exporter TauE/SafE family protein [Haliea sp. SAOS-164]
MSEILALLGEWLPVILALLLTGAIAGVLAGLLGVGGGIVIVPVLYLVFQSLGMEPGSAMLVATGTSLLTIIPTSISSARAHHARGNVDTALLRLWVAPMVIAVICGSLLAARSGGLLLTAIFGTVAILVALNMLLRANAPAVFQSLPGVPGQMGMAGGIGFFSVMMGIGGGTLGVPTMTLCNVPTHRAVGTAAVFGLVIAVPGALVMLLQGVTPADAPAGTLGLVNLPGFAVIVPMTTLMAPLGVRLGAKLDGATLKRVFAVFLIIVGVRMLWQTFA